MTTTSPPDWRTASVPTLLSGLFGPDPIDAVPRLSLLAVVTALGSPWGLLAVPLAVFLLFDARRCRRPFVWFTAAAGLAATHLPEWEGVDNHQWLLVYWCLALGTAFLATDPRSALARQGALLVALVFGLAVVWKVTSGEYVDGSFFHHTLLTDPRFEPVARLAGGLSADAYDANQVAGTALRDGAVASVDLISSGRLRAVAIAMTCWGILLEAAIAIGFVATSRRAVSRFRHAPIFLFCATTYVVVPVVIFGWLVATMGYATTGDDEKIARRAYAALFAFLLVWAPLWRLLTGVPA